MYTSDRHLISCCWAIYISDILTPLQPTSTYLTAIIVIQILKVRDNYICPMCDYTQVQYKCSHLRYVVRAWCTKYQETHKRCPANVVAM